ncbi:PREDICTED: uncharacterized protein LOC109126539 [Camelina sativa]|uniref:Uncharacterized protein LOC109126539 n=1 Tax=Camelina sativa TaxID=90675 RepID=A0ABM1QG63_CAMSA|nr:PREDICTED: uncharacterized protein LOC109126539 [Camelina sativa]
MATSPKLTLRSGTQLADPAKYRRIVGSLQYLAFTRPDISYAVNRLSQFMHQPSTDHWTAMKRVLRYLAGTLDHGILLKRGINRSLHAYTDTDWAGDSNDYVSTNGYIVYLGQHPISWSSKKQRSIAKSSTEAEYQSVATTSTELNWICSLLKELGVSFTTPPVIYCDNIGIKFSPGNSVVHVSTKDQLADAFTKPVSRAAFTNFSTKIGVTKVPSS